MPGEESEAENGEEEESQDTASASIPEETPVIVFENVHKEYEGQIEDSVALTDVSFSIRKGEFVFIVGPSGSGKSTMIRLMMREISPSKGKILIAGKNLAKLRRRQVSKYRRNIGIVFQDFRLLPDRSVYDNVAFAQRVVGAPKRSIPKEVSKVLHLVGLSQKYKSFPNELSGGEQQRVAIARALVNNPMIILADEPTGNLDPQNSYEIMSLLEEINRRGTTVVIVTHDREVVNRMQKRVVALQEGTIIEDKRGGYNNRG
ncbi:MAG: cell division ATP-binding protein FtsE [Lachnospiraceae bacterium]|nr:cell division ATP-binding protein FtsE [Lachnospiraceae bacterium]